MLSAILKNEFKEASRNYLMLLIGSVVSILIMFVTLFILISRDYEQYASNLFAYGIVGIIFAASAIAVIIVAIVYIINVVKNYKDDFFTNKAYLKFTLPVDSKNYLLAKIITTLVWSFIINIAVALVFFIVFGIFLAYENINLSDLKYAINLSFGATSIISFLEGLLSSVLALLLLYFSITLTKMIFKNSKNGNVWFFIYLGITIVYGIVTGILSSVHLNLTDGDMTINIATLILQIVLAIAIFFITSRMIEKKLDF